MILGSFLIKLKRKMLMMREMMMMALLILTITMKRGRVLKTRLRIKRTSMTLRWKKEQKKSLKFHLMDDWSADCVKAARSARAQSEAWWSREEPRKKKKKKKKKKKMMMMMKDCPHQDEKEKGLFRRSGAERSGRERGR